MTGRAELTRTLAGEGFIAAAEEADELLAAAHGDGELLAAMLARRLRGEPLAWVTGTTTFCGVTVRVDPGVYVPRWHTELVAQRAAARLPDHGVGVDLCTGSGAVATVLMNAHPSARVVGTDVDARAVACARANGVEAYAGDLFAPLPGELAGCVDVIVAVVPYVPTSELSLLQRDTFTFESRVPYDGGGDGGDVLRRVVASAPRYLRPRGALVLELGGDQATRLAPDLRRHGFTRLATIVDDDGDVRGVEATLGARG